MPRIRLREHLKVSAPERQAKQRAKGLGQLKSQVVAERRHFHYRNDRNQWPRERYHLDSVCWQAPVLYWRSLGHRILPIGHPTQFL